MKNEIIIKRLALISVLCYPCLSGNLYASDETTAISTIPDAIVVDVVIRENDTRHETPVSELGLPMPEVSTTDSEYDSESESAAEENKVLVIEVEAIEHKVQAETQPNEQDSTEAQVENKDDEQNPDEANEETGDTNEPADENINIENFSDILTPICNYINTFYDDKIIKDGIESLSANADSVHNTHDAALILYKIYELVYTFYQNTDNKQTILDDNPLKLLNEFSDRLPLLIAFSKILQDKFNAEENLHSDDGCISYTIACLIEYLAIFKDASIPNSNIEEVFKKLHDIYFTE
jgi:hypothetical protein